MKRVLTLFLVLAMAFSATACSFSDLQKELENAMKESEQVSTDGDSEDNTKDNAEEQETEKDNSNASSDFSIDETVLLDQDNVKITAKSLAYDYYGDLILDVLIENNTDQTLNFSIDQFAINGYMTEYAFLYATVSAGKKSNETIDIPKDELDFLDIKTAADMTMTFSVSIEEYDEYLRSAPVQLKTSAAETYDYKYDDSGEVIYDGSNIKIVAKGLFENAKYDTQSILLYIENNNDFNITMSTDNVSVNGFMIDPFFYYDMLPNSHALATVDFDKEELASNDISAIKDVTLSFHIIDDDWDTVTESGEINITF